MMPRQIDPFEPHPRFENAAGARFWPDTLFVDLSAYPDEVQSFDYDEMRLLEEADLSIFVAAAARTHEQLHWLQLAGTSFGRFLAFNRVTTGDLADAILTTATPAELAALKDQRNRGVAPAQRDRQGQLRHAFGYSTTVQSLFDHWWATVALEHFLIDDGIPLLGPIDPRFMVGLGLRYVAAGEDLRSVFNAPDETFLKTTLALGPSDEFSSFPRQSRLTVRHIEEAAALVEQYLCHADFARQLPDERSVEFGARALAVTLERFMDKRHSLYTEALNFYVQHIPGDDVPHFFELFLLICDIALNPVIPSDGSPLDCTWDEFHPVGRFERLVSGLATFKPVCGGLENAPAMCWWLNERERLVTHVGLGDDPHSAAFYPTELPSLDPLHQPSDCLRQFLAMAGTNLSSLRRKFPAAIASPLHSLQDDMQAFVGLVDSLEGPGFDPPLNIKSFGDGERSLSISAKLYVETLFAVTARRAVHSWLVRSGDLNFSGLPTDRVGQLAQEAAAQRLRDLYGIVA
ncbi:hypothetical protein B5C34_02700 [Pacificimonas flava]|uniref:Uncharacterized protein n=2 Tax=Pacificimonas TaxID=1960290 RepID=A0A219B3T3_9SPHN|nr:MULTISPECIES: hypothetical protein [Pacificimonas]MBZ6377869.1 hypothetical protein [Pacificimonas aurantium]OWV32469.1 hypothetical protein B5C34_02700 [Pacificimonas flava]